VPAGRKEQGRVRRFTGVNRGLAPCRHDLPVAWSDLTGAISIGTVVLYEVHVLHDERWTICSAGRDEAEVREIAQDYARRPELAGVRLVKEIYNPRNGRAAERVLFERLRPRQQRRAFLGLAARPPARPVAQGTPPPRARPAPPRPRPREGMGFAAALSIAVAALLAVTVVSAVAMS
jgi:hypothetical protein